MALYPDPGVLVRSVRNTLEPQVQPQAVAALAATLPDDPAAIETYVLERQVPYAYDWQSAGVPWYFLALILLWNALARLLGAGRPAADGLLPVERERRRRWFRASPATVPAHRRFGLPRAQGV